MSDQISVAGVRASLLERREIALLDPREEGSFAESHPLFAASLPLSRLEIEVFERLPRKTVPIVVYDAGEGLAERAAARLRQLGYGNVRLLAGGLAAWAAARAELFRDVNSPSKAFGELVETVRHTPSIAPRDLNAKVADHENMVVLDARRFEEYEVMSIPSATSVPGGELVLRVRELAPDPQTLVVVNCAGRTRSIVGTQSLINAGIPNPVVALRNGTIGWTLAGLDLEHCQARRADVMSNVPHPDQQNAAQTLAKRAGVGTIAWEQLLCWMEDPSRTLYRFDVRTPEEYVLGHLGGFRSAPGGQLVQETDVFAPVRGARIVLTDIDGVRAPMTASWLAQMGWDVHVLLQWPHEVELEYGASPRRLPPLPAVPTISAQSLAKRFEEQWAIVDLASSADYARGHVPGALFALRSQLGQVLSAAKTEAPIVLTSTDGALARFAAADLGTVRGRPALVLEGGTQAWAAAGFHLEAGLQRFLSPPIDRYKRPYEGTDNATEAMQAYLDWEYGLVAQLEKDGTHHFSVL